MGKRPRRTPAIVILSLVPRGDAWEQVDAMLRGCASLVPGLREQLNYQLFGSHLIAQLHGTTAQLDEMVEDMQDLHKIISCAPQLMELLQEPPEVAFGNLDLRREGNVIFLP